MRRFRAGGVVRPPYAALVEHGYAHMLQPRDADHRFVPLVPMAVTGAPQDRRPRPGEHPSPRPNHDRDCDCNRCRYGNV